MGIVEACPRSFYKCEMGITHFAPKPPKAASGLMRSFASHEPLVKIYVHKRVNLHFGMFIERTFKNFKFLNGGGLKWLSQA